MRRRTKDICADLAEERFQRLRSLAAGLRNDDRTEVEVVGQPHVEVLNHVLEHDYDLVVIGGGNAETSERQELPSGVTQLRRMCPIPAWVMRTPTARHPAHPGAGRSGCGRSDPRSPQRLRARPRCVTCTQ